MIYQESMMRIAQKFAGYTLEEADNLRKACGKKIREVMAKEKVGFVQGCDRHRLWRRGRREVVGADRTVRRLRVQQEPQLRLRLHRVPDRLPQGALPGRVHGVLLTSVKSNLDKAAGYLHECRIMGIDVLVPDVNLAESDFTAAGSRRPGTAELDRLRPVRGAQRRRRPGRRLLVEEREANGPVRRLLSTSASVSTRRC